MKHTRQLDAFSQAVGQVRKDDHHAELQGGGLPQIKVFQKLFGELGKSNVMKKKHRVNTTQQEDQSSL